MTNASLKRSAEIATQKLDDLMRAMTSRHEAWQNLLGKLGPAPAERELEGEEFCPEKADALINEREASGDACYLQLEATCDSHEPLQALEKIVSAMSAGKIQTASFRLRGFCCEQIYGLFAFHDDEAFEQQKFMNPNRLLEALKSQKHLISCSIPQAPHITDQVEDICVSRLNEARRLLELAKGELLLIAPGEKQAILDHMPLMEENLRAFAAQTPHISSKNLLALLDIDFNTDPYFQFTPEQLRTIATNIAAIKADASLLPPRPATQANGIVQERKAEMK